MIAYLIGFMGCGKSSIGKRLAERLKCPFVDLDEVIVETVGKSIPEIFKEQGEEAFRIIERNALTDTFRLQNAVVATGGGVPCHFDNMARINEHGLSFYLKNDVDFFVDKLLGNTGRPLVAGMSEPELREYISATLARREPDYLQAQYVFTVGQLGKKTTARLISSIAKANIRSLKKAV